MEPCEWHRALRIQQENSSGTETNLNLTHCMINEIMRNGKPCADRQFIICKFQHAQKYLAANKEGRQPIIVTHRTANIQQCRNQFQ